MEDTLWLANMRGNAILGFDLVDCQWSSEIRHPLLNLPHSLWAITTDKWLLVVSTGTDAILAFDLHGELVWDWLAVEHGFIYDPLGYPSQVHRGGDYAQCFIPTIHQVTHINSAIDVGDSSIFATLFHQGTVVEIDRKSGNHRVLVQGLLRPHAVRPMTCDKYLVSDSARGRVVEFEPRSRRVREVVSGYGWVSDALLLRPGLLGVLDSDASRLALVDFKSKREVAAIQFDADWRPYQVLCIPEKVAARLYRLDSSCENTRGPLPRFTDQLPEP